MISLRAWAICLLIISSSIYSYTFNRSKYGDFVKWSPDTAQVNIFYDQNAGNTVSSGSQKSFSEVLSEAKSSWQNSIPFNISLFTLNQVPRGSQNDVYFSNSSAYFSGSGVLAITLISFNDDNGIIKEADIVIDSSQNFTYDSSDTDHSDDSGYIGDVLTHEMGHFFGLSHSEVRNSTMFYSLIHGQRTLHTDDKSGGHTLYSESSTKGTITGNVKGGDSVGIFGAQVSAISQRTGLVVASSFSEQDGKFKIGGLPLNDVYFLYIEPMQSISNLPLFYKEVKTDFCQNGASYRGSFFQTCGASDEGFPQGINLTSSSKTKDVGVASIKCNLDAPNEYLRSKGGTFNIESRDFAGNFGNTFSGYFTKADVLASSADTISIDLDQYSAPINSFLEIKIQSQDLYAPYDLSVLAQRIDAGVADQTIIKGQDGDGNPKIDGVLRIALDSVTSANNIFTVTVTPSNYNLYHIADTCVPSVTFPACSEYGDNQFFYLLSYEIVKEGSDGSFSSISKRDYGNISGNESCLDGPQSYSVTSNSEEKTESIKALIDEQNETDDSPLSCGQVDIDRGGGAGPGSFLIGFLLSLFLLKLRNSARNLHNAVFFIN